MEWWHSGSPCPKKFRVQISAGKFVALIFFFQGGIHIFNYFPKGQTIYEDYYSSLLVQLKDVLKEKRGGKFCKGVLSLKDNAPCHQTLATQNKLAYLDFHCTDHTLFSGSGLVGIPPLPWTGKIIEKSQF